MNTNLTLAEFRLEVNKLLSRVERHDLSERIRIELRRTYDSDSTNRKRRLTVKKAMREWADKHLVADISPNPPGVLGQEAFGQYLKDTKGASTYGGIRSFYDTLREAGYPIEKRPGYHTRILDMEYQP